MALYEFACNKCGLNFEEIMSFKSSEQVTCPDCGTKASRKISRCSHRWKNPFNSDGEGFSSESYSLKEADHRVKHNVPKGVKV